MLSEMKIAQENFRIGDDGNEFDDVVQFDWPLTTVEQLKLLDTNLQNGVFLKQFVSSFAILHSESLKL